MKLYSNDLKKIVCHRTCEDKERISDVSKELNLPVKTIEKWVALYRKDPTSFDGIENYEFAKRKIHAAIYNDLDKKSLIAELKRKDSRIEYLESVIVSKDYQIKTMEKES